MNILLAPLQGRLPTTDAELTQLQAYIRRLGHMVDVRGQGKRRHFFSYDDPAPDTAIAPATYAVTGSSSAPAASAASAPSHSYPVYQQQQQPQRQVADDYYSGTDTDTSSDDWNEIYTFADLAHHPPEQIAERLDTPSRGSDVSRRSLFAAFDAL